MEHTQKQRGYETSARGTQINLARESEKSIRTGGTR